MTLQPILDFVARHLLTQNRRAITPDRLCFYLTPAGLSCAVGCLIRNYNPDLEGETIFNKDYRQQFNAALGHILTEDDVSFLSSLQNIHDHCDPIYWEYYLRELAIRHKLLPFSRCDLEGGRGREHPFPLRPTAQEGRAMDPLS